MFNNLVFFSIVINTNKISTIFSSFLKKYPLNKNKFYKHINSYILLIVNIMKI